jgi:L-lactate dehydrogenase complex protein LldG
MSNGNRERILANIRANTPSKRVEHPPVPVFHRPELDLRSSFERHLADAGGAAHEIGSRSEAEAKLASLHPKALVICSAVPEIPGTRRAEAVRDPHELADVDVGVVRAQFGVAENGAVWLTQEDLIVNSLGFLSQHLIVFLDPKEIAADMHEAYTRVRLDQTAYGCFMMGPSATGDIEATMVHGAQGARSLNVFFLTANADANNLST